MNTLGSVFSAHSYRNWYDAERQSLPAYGQAHTFYPVLAETHNTSTLVMG